MQALGLSVYEAPKPDAPQRKVLINQQHLTPEFRAMVVADMPAQIHIHITRRQTARRSVILPRHTTRLLFPIPSQEGQGVGFPALQEKRVRETLNKA